ncbi:hypothetical protein [Streptomyces roseicoloratus]|uniref:Uncharacterized protein n=1 Tax=Streptomyces roseicoloratus TaxID=2508722 RepID=A0ABY9S419_9ACTN|nr:hypothetical protein [Streptomyces roseicoloratus]WMX43592.1 hypothetical protein RGF97_00065 [Streptomyces roseicoloratus]WMX48683.1 hypothetical protein RGF97_33205 [Streptomyces roseicoloratus]
MVPRDGDRLDDHQRRRDERKLQVPISSFRRWVHATLPDEAATSQVTVLRDDIEPGSETQIDHDFPGPPAFDPAQRSPGYSTPHAR